MKKEKKKSWCRHRYDYDYQYTIRTYWEVACRTVLLCMRNVLVFFQLYWRAATRAWLFVACKKKRKQRTKKEKQEKKKGGRPRLESRWYPPSDSLLSALVLTEGRKLHLKHRKMRIETLTRCIFGIGVLSNSKWRWDEYSVAKSASTQPILQLNFAQPIGFDTPFKFTQM